MLYYIYSVSSSVLSYFIPAPIATLTGVAIATTTGAIAPVTIALSAITNPGMCIVGYTCYLLLA